MNKKLRTLIAVLMCMAITFAFAACGSDGSDGTDDQTATKATEETVNVDSQAETITVSGMADENGTALEEKTYTLDDVEALGMETRTYSGRNKKVENARQFMEFSGVDLGTFLKDAGVDATDLDDVIIKVICADNYQNEYEFEDISEERYAYSNNESNERTAITAMLACVTDEDGEYPSPFKIVYGQADFDTYDNSAQDFNTQGWGLYIVKMEISFEDED